MHLRSNDCMVDRGIQGKLEHSGAYSVKCLSRLEYHVPSSPASLEQMCVYRAYLDVFQHSSSCMHASKPAWQLRKGPGIFPSSEAITVSFINL